MQAYIGNGKYIFVSYAHKDKDIAYPFIEALQKRFNVWYDDGIRLGSDYRRDIMNRLKSSSLFLFLVSNNSLNSDFCNKEIHFAETKGINFINIIIENIELPDWFEFDYGLLQNFYLYHRLLFQMYFPRLHRNKANMPKMTIEALMSKSYY